MVTNENLSTYVPSRVLRMSVRTEACIEKSAYGDCDTDDDIYITHVLADAASMGTDMLVTGTLRVL